MKGALKKPVPATFEKGDGSGGACAGSSSGIKKALLFAMTPEQFYLVIGRLVWLGCPKAPGLNS